MPDVVIYTKSWCGYCTRAKTLLTCKGVDFKEIEISDDVALRDEMIERAGGRKTVPQIFIGDTQCRRLRRPLPVGERRAARFATGLIERIPEAASDSRKLAVDRSGSLRILRPTLTER
jgi:glutaredoxin 3